MELVIMTFVTSVPTPIPLPIPISAGANDRSFYLIFNIRIDDLKTLLTICRHKYVSWVTVQAFSAQFPV